MRTKRDIVGFPNFEKPVHIEMQQLRQNIADYQRRSKQYTDERRRARPFKGSVGDYVRVKLPTHPAKGTPAFEQPERIQKAVGQNTFVTSGGGCWNSSRLSRAYVPDGSQSHEENTGPGEDAADAEQPLPLMLRRSNRSWNPPDRCSP